MICIQNTKTQVLKQQDAVAFSESQSLSCSAQLQDNHANLFFPGIYEVQWSVICKSKTNGCLHFQAYNGDKPITGSIVIEQADVGFTRTLTVAPVFVVSKQPDEVLSVALRNAGGDVEIFNAVLTVRKLF